MPCREKKSVTYKTREIEATRICPNLAYRLRPTTYRCYTSQLFCMYIDVCAHACVRVHVCGMYQELASTWFRFEPYYIQHRFDTVSVFHSFITARTRSSKAVWNRSRRHFRHTDDDHFPTPRSHLQRRTYYLLLDLTAPTCYGCSQDTCLQQCKLRQRSKYFIILSYISLC